MSAEIVNFADNAERYERDRQAFRLRLAGVSERQIAEQLKCSRDDVRGSLMRMAGGVTPELRARTIEMEMERLDDMQKAFYLKVTAGDETACAIVLRIMDHRAKMLGLYAPPRSDSALDTAMPQVQSSTDRIAAAIQRVARGPVIEGEAVEVKADD